MFHDIQQKVIVHNSTHAHACDSTKCVSFAILHVKIIVNCQSWIFAKKVHIQKVPIGCNINCTTLYGKDNNPNPILVLQ
jgi:hypothetical protein